MKIFSHRIFAFLTALLILLSGHTSMAQEKPNLLIIHTDEHNFRTLGCYRKVLDNDRAFVWGDQAIVETPNIDSLAESGVLCTSFYANTPVCSPSRAAFVTGMYPQNTPSYKNNIPLSGMMESFATPLLNAGYKTGYAGKWHLDGDGKPQWTPERQFGFTANTYMFNRGHWKKMGEDENGPFVAGTNDNGEINYDVDEADENSYTTDFLTDRAIRFIKANRDDPFCFMLSFPDPHGPNTVRAPYDTMFNDLEFTKPLTASKPDDNLPSWGEKQSGTITGSAMAKYFGMVKCIDDNIGRIVDVLKTEGLIEKTIIIFTSDHGDLLGEHSRDNKGVPYEASAKVPFIIRYPGKLMQGVIVSEAISNVDFKPTILSIMNIPLIQSVEGKDVSGLFLEDSKAAEADNIAFIRGTGNWVGAVTDRYKLIFSMDSDPWLFDLEMDPDEIINFYFEDTYRFVISSLASQLKAYGVAFSDPWLDDPRIRTQVDQSILVSGTDFQKNAGYSIYPDPNNKGFLLISGLDFNSHIEIYNLQGKKMMDIFSQEVHVNLSDLQRGIYFMKINQSSILPFSMLH